MLQIVFYHWWTRTMYSSPACLAVFAVVEILIRPTVIDLLFVVFIVVCVCLLFVAGRLFRHIHHRLLCRL